MRSSIIVVTILVFACLFQFVVPNDPKIIGGSFATKGQFPFIVQLFDATQDYNFCGGSLLGPYHILTAAHCVDGKTKTDIQIWAGALNIYDASGYKVNVAKVTMYPNYNSTSLEHDVTVIKLAKPFPKSVGVRTIRLATSKVAVGTSVTTCGWGNTGNSYPEDLMYVETKILSRAQCIQYYPAYYIINDAMVCAHDPNQGSCQGDSGGPMFTSSGISALQHGVVSWGSGEGCATAPSVYARVSTYYNWIVAQTKHSVKTSCSGCATNAKWKAMCESIGGTYRLISTGYQCQNLNFVKTRKISYSWTGCTNTKLRDLCNKIGRYTCTNNVGKCTRL